LTQKYIEDLPDQLIEVKEEDGTWEAAVVYRAKGTNQVCLWFGDDNYEGLDGTYTRELGEFKIFDGDGDEVPTRRSITFMMNARHNKETQGRNGGSGGSAAPNQSRALPSVSTTAQKRRRNSVSARDWCDICRGDTDEESIMCNGCPSLFHLECVAEYEPPTEEAESPLWFCDACKAGQEEVEADGQERALGEGRIKAVQKSHKGLKQRLAWYFLDSEQSRIKPFADPVQLKKMMALRGEPQSEDLPPIVAGATYVTGELRDYQA